MNVLFILVIVFVDGREVEPLLSIVILWRRDTSHVKYEWLNEKWEADETKLNSTTMKLESTISRLLRSTEALTYEALVKVCENFDYEKLVLKFCLVNLGSF